MHLPRPPLRRIASAAGRARPPTSAREPAPRGGRRHGEEHPGPPHGRGRRREARADGRQHRGAPGRRRGHQQGPPERHEAPPDIRRPAADRAPPAAAALGDAPRAAVHRRHLRRGAQVPVPRGQRPADRPHRHAQGEDALRRRALRVERAAVRRDPGGRHLRRRRGPGAADAPLGRARVQPRERAAPRGRRPEHHHAAAGLPERRGGGEPAGGQGQGDRRRPQRRLDDHHPARPARAPADQPPQAVRAPRRGARRLLESHGRLLHDGRLARRAQEALRPALRPAAPDAGGAPAVLRLHEPRAAVHGHRRGDGQDGDGARTREVRAVLARPRSRRARPTPGVVGIRRRGGGNGACAAPRPWSPVHLVRGGITGPDALHHRPPRPRPPRRRSSGTGR